MQRKQKYMHLSPHPQDKEAGQAEENCKRDKLLKRSQYELKTTPAKGNREGEVTGTTKNQQETEWPGSSVRPRESTFAAKRNRKNTHTLCIVMNCIMLKYLWKKT